MATSVPVAKASNSKGFTLLEILLTITIIGVLAVIVLAVSQRVRDFSGKVTCVNNLRQLAGAGHGYATDNQGRLPDSSYWCRIPAKSESVYQLSLWPYLGGMEEEARDKKSILTCPAIQRRYPAKVPSTLTSVGQRTYTLNTYAIGSMAGVKDESDPDGAALKKSRVRMSNVAQPSRMVFFLEGPVIPPAALFSSLFAPIYLRSTDPSKTGTGGTDYLHSGSINVAFLDGHVESISQQQGEGLKESPSLPFWGAKE